MIKRKEKKKSKVGRCSKRKIFLVHQKEGLSTSDTSVKNFSFHTSCVFLSLCYTRKNKTNLSGICTVLPKKYKKKQQKKHYFLQTLHMLVAIYPTKQSELGFRSISSTQHGVVMPRKLKGNEIYLKWARSYRNTSNTWHKKKVIDYRFVQFLGLASLTKHFVSLLT